MSAPERRPFPARRNAVLVVLAVAAATAMLVFAFMHTDGPVARCEAAGGQMLVGPGGETSCVNPRTFLPMDSLPEGKPAR